MLSIAGTILCLCPFFLLWLIFHDRNLDWRKALLRAAVFWALTLTLIIELLSHFSQLNFVFLLVTWLIVDILLFLIYSQQNSSLKLFNTIRIWCKYLLKLHPFVIFSLTSIVLLTTALGLIAIVVPPNNWDSMTYHMSRVVNWIQNKSVNHYPTHILRQLDQPPWAEYAILNFQILTKGDYLANLVQWFSMIGSTIGVSLIAKHLGAKSIAQVLASVICATIPMGILQSTTTQNDYVAAFWLVCFVDGIVFLQKQPVTKINYLELGASLGLAVLTKATAYIYAFPFFILGLISLVGRLRWRLWQPILLGFTSFFSLNIHYWWRNFTLLATPLGISGDITKNELFTLSALISNLTRNTSIHLVNFHSGWNDFLEKAIISIHQILNLDVSEPSTTFLDTKFQLPVASEDQAIFLHEDHAGNPIHFLLILIAILLLCSTRNRRNYLLNKYLLALVGGLILFNYLIAWQPWASRLHLPIFVLFSPLIAITFVASKLLNHILIKYLLVTVLIFNSLPYVFFNSSKPVLHNPFFLAFTNKKIWQLERQQQYFNVRPELQKSAHDILRSAEKNSCHKIGFYIDGDSWEYPFWIMLQNSSHLPQPLQFKSVGIGNKSASIAVDLQPTRQFSPCLVVVGDFNQREKLSLPEGEYYRSETSGILQIFLKQ